MLNTMRLQSPHHKKEIEEILSLCDEANKKQSFAKISYLMKDLSVELEQEFFDKRDSMQKKYQGFIRDIKSRDTSLYTPTQISIIKKVEVLSEDKKTNPSEILSLLSELSLDMSVSMSAYRKESYGDKEIGNSEYVKGVETVMAADVATAGKRISRDLTRLSKQLKNTGSTDPEVIKILNEIESAQNGEVKFYESIDLLSKVTWLLYQLNDRSVSREKEYLLSISNQFSDISRSCIESLKISGDSETELLDFNNEFSKEIEAIAKSSRGAESLSELKVTIAQQVEKMQEKLSMHILSQSQKINKQKNIIEVQSNKIDLLSNKVEEQQSKINDIKIESGLDQLTKLPNRRHYDSHIASLREEYIRNGGELSLMVLDIDHFKSINDTHGHAVGDIVLNEFGKILKRVCSKVNGLFAARYGGEEFILVGRNISKIKFKNVARRIREYVEAKSFNVGENKSIKYTVSIGISFFNGKDDLVDYVFRSADKALYQAKKSGRNQLWISNKTMLLKSEEKSS